MLQINVVLENICRVVFIPETRSGRPEPPGSVSLRFWTLIMFLLTAEGLKSVMVRNYMCALRTWIRTRTGWPLGSRRSRQTDPHRGNLPSILHTATRRRYAGTVKFELQQDKTTEMTEKSCSFVLKSQQRKGQRSAVLLLPGSEGLNWFCCLWKSTDSGSVSAK